MKTDGRLHLLGGPLLCLLLAAVACGGDSSPTSPSTPNTPATPAFSEASFREAGRITGAAQDSVLRAARAGQYERDVKNLVSVVFQAAGGGPPAFDHIVATGANALSLHYAGDSSQLVDGDLLLVDIGATSNGHCSDSTRTFPVSGQFTPRQREIYELVLDGHMLAATQGQVGVDSLETLDSRVRTFFKSSSLRAKSGSGVETTMNTFFVHSLCHYVGRQVHGEDTGWNPQAPIAVGQVLTIEPGLYIASEGLGIRIEDSYLATSHGLECLTCGAPKEPYAVERASAGVAARIR